MLTPFITLFHSKQQITIKKRNLNLNF
jgi:hypothetical protein